MVLDEKRVVAYSWIKFKSRYESKSQVSRKTNNEVAYLFDSYVIPEYRNNSMHSALTTTRLMYLHSHGYEKARTGVEDKNTYALKTMASAGFKPTRAVFFFTIFGLKFHRWQKHSGNL